MFFRKTKKLAVGILLTLFVFSSFTEFIFSAQPAQAQLGVAVIADAVQQADDIFTTIKNGFKIAVMNAAQQAVGYFLRKVAYDSAVWLASGGKGQTPFAHTKSVGSYLQDVGNDAAGAAIDSLGTNFGLDLCKIPDVKIDLALRIGLHYNFGAEPPKPACSLSTFYGNWSGSLSSVYNNGVDPSKVFSQSFRVDDTDLGINIKTTEKVDRLFLQQQDDARATRAEGGGFRAVTGLVDNRIKTPAQVTADEMKANAPNKQNERSQAQIGAAMGSGAYEIIPSTLSIFLNTLSSQMLKNFRENGMLPFGVGCVSIDGVTGGKCPASSVASNPNSAGTELTGRVAAESAFNEFLTTKLGAINNYDIVSQLSSCDARGLYNCRIDQGLVQAIQESKNNGDLVTIAQAIKKDWLHGGWKLVPPSNFANNADRDCFKNNYCYSNVAVLRQLGIFPLGMEIAAKNSSPDHPVSLEEVVKGFYDCNYQKDGQGNVLGINYDPVNFPYCHLIDPNWVIKLEQVRCDAFGYGPTPIGKDVPDRLQECMDLKTCVGHDSKGNCSGWGYCVLEKNVWAFDPSLKCGGKNGEYATCRSFTNSQGQSLSYLYRTLDTGTCAQDNVGCTAYSLNQDDKGWKDPKVLNEGIYLNKKVSSCNSSSAGCSAFRLGDSLAYLKKAPDYLNCYDTDANSSNGVTWPQTLSDLIKMKPKPECKDYTQVCIASEVGCSLFKNINDPDAPAIPGKFSPAQVENKVVKSWNDQCDAHCVGYNAYQEMPTSYSAGNPVAYIIPPSKYNNKESGTECKAQDKGCTSFTNMEATESGGEKVENFTLLRNCIKPDQTKQKNFYTYEGSGAGGTGYQLQVFTLQKDVDGSPLVVFKDNDEKDYADQYKCNETLYKNNVADAACRQFNDDQGKVYYALLPNTVAVSDSCSQYRLNSGELAGVDKCFGNGQFKNGACYYYGLPGGVDNSAGASEICSANVVSCRAYKGNHGNNIRSIDMDASSSDPVDTFETVASVSVQNGWSMINGTVNQSNESTHVGGHSLEFTGSINPLQGNAILAKSIKIASDEVDSASAQSYDLTFWAKGSGINVSGMNVALAAHDGGGQNVEVGTFSANNTWQLFKFSIRPPISSSSTLDAIVFKLQGNGNLFLDNIHLTKVSDLIYLVKNSLKVDSICDDNPDDNLPGAALGCTAYSGPKNSLNNNLYYLTNFSYLCRDGAIGCTAFKDTFNKVSDTGSRVYNVFLPVAAPGGVKAVLHVGANTYSCQVEQGKTGCYLKESINGHTIQEIKASSVNNALAPILNDSAYFIPPDSNDSSTIYLVADGSDNSVCNKIDVGCTNAGKQTVTPGGVKYLNTTIKIDPNQFQSGADANGNPQSGILCQKEAVGCDEYSSSKGSAYFKDPAVSGNKICSYQNFVDPVSNESVSGWFWKGVSVCGSTSTPAVLQDPKKYCVGDSDCSADNICLPDLKNKQACYPNYKKDGNYFDLWSFGDTDNYKNFVGECPAEEDTCTEFVDHADKNKAYYLFDNNKLSQGDCAGQVSQKSGCVLFDQTDKPNKIYNTFATYAQSDNTTYNKEADIFKITRVVPNTTGNLDANRIISVKRDRECAQWLQCMSSHSVFSDITGWSDVCDAVGVCDQTGGVNDKNNTAFNNCANFVDKNKKDYSGILTEENYSQRDIKWAGKDWVGYSILGKFVADEFSQINVGTDQFPVWTLGKKINCGGVNCLPNSPDDTACIVSKTPVPCGINNSGTCINSVCFQNVDGQPVKNVDLETLPQDCRAYPDKDSPFPNLESVKKSNDFKEVNLCEGSNNCECDYLKVSYGQSVSTRYFDFSHGIGKDNTGFCVGGVDDGKVCESKEDCDKGTGDCQFHKKDTQIVGWRGYCLEQDLSRTLFGDKDLHPCLSWFPVYTLSGAKDINFQHKEAGFESPDGTYCYKGNLFARPYVASTCGANGCSCPSGYSLAPKDNKTCLADFSIPYNTSLKPSVFGFGPYNAKPAKYQISCEQPVVIDDGVVVATDNAWKKGISLAGNNFYSPTKPYAVGNNGIYNTNLTGSKLTSGLIRLPWCQYGAFKFRKPNSDKGDGTLTCDDGFELQGGSNGGAYNPWGFRYGLEDDGGSPSDYAGLCKSDADCQQGELKADSTSGYCAFGCTKNADCGIGGKCLVYKGQSLCSEAAPNWDFDWSSMTSDPDELLKNKSTDPCGMGMTVGGVSLVGTYPDQVKANKICQASGGYQCVFQESPTNPYHATCTDNYPKSCISYQPVPCKNDNGDLVALTATTTIFEGDNGGVNKYAICGKKGDKPATCQNRPVGTTNPGEDYGLDMTINICSNMPLPAFVVAETNFKNAGNDLKTLLASVSTTYSWKNENNQSGYFLSKDWTWNNTFDLAGANGVGIASNPPVVHPVSDQCKTGEKCLEINENGISINNVWNKDIFIQSNAQRAVMKFYAWADKNHMTLRNMRVDWNDGTDAVLIDGYIRNNKGSFNTTCNKSNNTCVNGSGKKCTTDKDCQFLDACVDADSSPKDFGSIAFKTCDNSYFSFEHTYTCNSKNTQKYVLPTKDNPGQGGWTDNCPDSKNFPDGCCVFKPRVQVKDNWGWCNGICPGGPGGDQCYDDNNTGDIPKDECIQFNLDKSTTKFKGNILVAPSK